jgi:peptide/nickel transport system ATP-binding protein
MAETLIEFEDLSVEYRSEAGPVRAVDGVSLDVREGEILGLVGESGCGKTTLAMALLRMIEFPNRITGGQIRFQGLGDVVAFGPRQLKRYRWAEVAMVFQGAQNTLNPLLTISAQARLVLSSHRQPSGERDAAARLGRLCRLVNLDAERVLRSYPHELSGGMKQRVGIVMALLLEPRVVILDEPTTALDVISQALILENLKTIHRELGTTMIFVTHDMSVIAELADRVAVMYAAKLAELGTTDEVFYEAAHPYTQALMRAIPTPEADPADVRSIPGRPPDLQELPVGCRFQPRCPLAQAGCGAQPPLAEVSPGHRAACILVEPSARPAGRG